MTVLSVNLNKVALLRNARDIGIPSIIESAKICIASGAGGITVHPRPDMRHIRPPDVLELAEMLTVEFNIEGNPFEGGEGDYPGFMSLVRSVKPAQCTLVPDAPDQKTSDHGWNLEKDGERLSHLQLLKKLCYPAADTILESHKLRAPRIHCNCFPRDRFPQQSALFRETDCKNIFS